MKSFELSSNYEYKRHHPAVTLCNELRCLHPVICTPTSPLWVLLALRCCTHCVFSDVDSITDSHIDSVFSAGQQKNKEA